MGISFINAAVVKAGDSIRKRNTILQTKLMLIWKLIVSRAL